MSGHNFRCELSIVRLKNLSNKGTAKMKQAHMQQKFLPDFKSFVGKLTYQAGIAFRWDNRQLP